MSSTQVTLISECFIKPLDDLSPEAKQPIHFTPFELPYLRIKYNQKGLLFAKPQENQDFSVTTFLNDLQHSLSATLTHFYPLAARLTTKKHVIYLDPENIAGVKFIYATTDATLSNVLNPPYVPSLVNSFFDLNEVVSHDAHTLPILSIQVTELVDGIFIGCSVNHMVADGTTFWHFMGTWSEIFQSGGQYHGAVSHPPIFKRWVLDGYDPIITLHHDQYNTERVELENNIILPFKRRFFSLSSTSISKLKAKANSECNTQNISSLQAVLALLWRCITRARCLPRDGETSCSFMVSTRRRLNPPLSDYYFGNPIQPVGCKASVEELLAHGIGWVALLLNEAAINHDDKAIKEMVESWIRKPVIYGMSQQADPNAVHVGSSPRFDMYGCEFGLGKAVAARSGSTYKGDGMITMYPGREGGGSMCVEVCLLPEYMKNIESDEEFMSVVMIN